jgi:hypothetical protein
MGLQDLRSHNDSLSSTPSFAKATEGLWPFWPYPMSLTSSLFSSIRTRLEERSCGIVHYCKN